MPLFMLITVRVLFFQYQQRVPEAPQGVAVVPSASDQQRHVHQAEQGHDQHDPNDRPLRGLGIPQPEDGARACVQARLWQG
jgi:hypothetical protein